MFETLLAHALGQQLAPGAVGSRAWSVIAVAAGGLRLIRYVARDDDDVLYRTV